MLTKSAIISLLIGFVMLVLGILAFYGTHQLAPDVIDGWGPTLWLIVCLTAAQAEIILFDHVYSDTVARIVVLFITIMLTMALGLFAAMLGQVHWIVVIAACSGYTIGLQLAIAGSLRLLAVAKTRASASL